MKLVAMPGYLLCDMSQGDKAMSRRNRLIGGVVAVLGLLVTPSDAEEISKSSDKVTIRDLIISIKHVEGFFTYKSGGVPLLGYIEERLVDPLVKFNACGEKTYELNSRLLVPSTAKCPATPDSKTTPWHVDGGKLVPLPEFARGTKDLLYTGAQIEVNDLPDKYQKALKKIESGDWAAVSYTAKNGEKVLGIFSKPDIPYR
jgi:hypothetical protein